MNMIYCFVSGLEIEIEVETHLMFASAPTKDF